MAQTAAASPIRAAAAIREGRFASQIVPVQVKVKREMVGFARSVQLDASAEMVAKDQVLNTPVVGAKAADNPWGEGATTLEWQVSSPPPFHTFDELPRIR